MKYPLPLKKGDIIGITAPSMGVSGVISKKIDNSIKQLEMMDYKCVETASVRNISKLTSALHEIRAQEFMSLYCNENVKAIIPPWGGELLMDMLPFLNFDLLKKLPPKWIMGFSDTSMLLFVLMLKLDMATLHGPNLLDFGSSSIDDSVLASLDILAKNNEKFIQQNLKYYQKEWFEITDTTFPPYNLTEKVIWKSLIEDRNYKFTGRLIGGNLDVICKLIGTPYAPVKEYIDKYYDDGFIWYFESCEMNAGDVYRTLLQMKMSGWFANCKGILYGRSEGLDAIEDFTFLDALTFAFKDTNIPIIYNVDIGHLPPQLTLINGSYAEVFYENGRGTIEQQMI
ncbi:S66 peptidase family protein [Clostridium sp. FP1]|uniref:S66 family peptidase n=1 Tax=Clostridium sp. FP1 TaxID=2724076 RepID=UPI0013E948E8|nr:S66 peptidase family protein [Clostridium sp. FP1]MBZ9633435.1 LD-carboxypeptidase [Clostridium sp. FP1]